MTYKIPVYEAEEVFQNNQNAVSEQVLSQLIQIIGQAFTPLQEPLQQLVNQSTGARMQIMNQLSLDRLNGGGHAFVSAYKAASEAERELLVAQLPVPAAQPYNRDDLVATLLRLTTKGQGPTRSFLNEIEIRGTLQSLQERISKPGAVLTLADSGLYRTEAGPQNPEMVHLVSAYKLAGATSVNRLLVATLVGDQLQVETKIHVPAENTWLDDPNQTYFSEKDLERAIIDHPVLKFNVHGRNLERANLIEELRGHLRNRPEITYTAGDNTWTAKVVDDEFVLTPADKLSLSEELLVLGGMILSSTAFPAEAANAAVEDTGEESPDHPAAPDQTANAVSGAE